MHGEGKGVFYIFRITTIEQFQKEKLAVFLPEL